MKILIVDDCKTEACCLRLILERMGHEAHFAEGGEAAWSDLKLGQFSVIISDWMMPDMDGLELCRRVRSQEGVAYTYFIFLTSRDNNKDRLEGLRAGADDFLAKPASRDELAVHLEMARRILDTQAELERKNKRLEALAMTDGLTELKNRRYFFEVLESKFDLATRQRLPLSLVMLDVDRFKSFNDAFGHPAGDEVLREVAKVIRTNCGIHDMAARYGGEEFVLMLEVAGPIESCRTAERLRAALQHHNWTHRPVTASFGVATMTREIRRPEELIEQADRALYQSKHLGGNRVTHSINLVWRPQVGVGSATEAREVRDLHRSDPSVVRILPEGVEEDPSHVLPSLASGDLAKEHDTIVESLLRTLDLCLPGSGDHSRRTTSVTMKLTRLLGFGESELVHIRRGSLLHDIGKICVPDAIINEPGPLTEKQWVEVRKHPSYARDILEPIVFLRPALMIPYAHHERWDGTGYPRGLSGEQIPRAARALAVADIYDVLTHDRPYRDAWPEEQALDHIDGLAGTHLDPEMVTALRQVIQSDHSTYRRFMEPDRLPEPSLDHSTTFCKCQS